MKLLYDTETSGLAFESLPPENPKQPRIVQLAAILTDDQGNEVSILKVMVKPDGFVVPENMVHGITNEQALKTGIPLKNALSIFGHLAFVADELIAFNDKYDRLVITGECIRVGFKAPFESRKTFYMMKPMENICKLPGSYPGKFKWPKLIEAHRYCFQKDFDAAHDAMADVRATINIWKWYQANVKPA